MLYWKIKTDSLKLISFLEIYQLDKSSLKSYGISDKWEWKPFHPPFLTARAAPFHFSNGFRLLPWQSARWDKQVGGQNEIPLWIRTGPASPCCQLCTLTWVSWHGLLPQCSQPWAGDELSTTFTSSAQWKVWLGVFLGWVLSEGSTSHCANCCQSLLMECVFLPWYVQEVLSRINTLFYPTYRMNACKFRDLMWNFAQE